MKFKTITGLLIISLFITGCASSLQYLRKNFHSYDNLASELKNIQSDITDLEIIGKTYENRNIYCLKIGRTSAENKPALLAIFAEHADEHEVTSLAMNFAKSLIDKYGKDPKITSILDTKDVYIVPMMNPDGAEYDLSGRVKPFSWRKNRRPTTDNAYGVDLNRNWGYMWDAPVSKKLKTQINNPHDPYYHGDNPFSELETQAIRDFLLTHRNIRIFVDYHSGYAGFMQGGIGFPFAYAEEEKLTPEHKERYEKIAQKFAELVTDPKDSRNGFIVSQTRDVKKNVMKYSPIYLKPLIALFVPKSTIAPGASADWVYGELGIMSFGIEILLDREFLKKAPESVNKLSENQIKGFIYLLENLTNDPFHM